jgi:addiction module HigA family antidote
MDSGLAPRGAPRNDEVMRGSVKYGVGEYQRRTRECGTMLYQAWCDDRETTMPRLQTHPGEVLREEYLVPLGLSARALAKLLGGPANRLTEIMRGTRDVSADTAIRLGRYFGTDPRFWLNLQAAHDLSKAERLHSYKKIVPLTAA